MKFVLPMEETRKDILLGQLVRWYADDSIGMDAQCEGGGGEVSWMHQQDLGCTDVVVKVVTTTSTLI